MKKRIMTGLLALCVLLLAFSGCNKADGEAELDTAAGPFGRYLEVDITPPDMAQYNGLSYASEQELALVSYRMDFNEALSSYDYHHYLHESDDGGTSWQTTELDWLEALRKELQAEGEPSAGRRVDLNTLQPLGGGELLLVLYIYESNGGTDESYYYRADKNGGNLRPFRLAPMEAIEAMGSGYRYSIWNLQPFPAEGTILAGVMVEERSEGHYITSSEYSGYHGLFDLATGELIQELPQWYAAYEGMGCFALTFTMEESRLYDSATGEELEIPHVHPDSVSYTSWFNRDGSVYYVDSSGLYLQRPDGQPPELVMNSTHYSFGSPVMSVSLFTSPQPESFVMSYWTSGNSVPVKRYDYDPQAENLVTGQLTVLGLQESDSVRQAIFAFGIAHPEIEVVYEYHYPKSNWEEPSSAMTEEDFLRNLTLRMLEKEGPDVLVLDGFPLESYIAQGALADISDVAAASSDLIPQVVAPMMEGDALYALPTQFAIPLLFTREMEAANYVSLDALIRAIDTSDVQPYVYDPDTMTDEAWDAYWAYTYNPLPLAQRPVIDFGNPTDALNAVLAGSQPALYTEDGLDAQALATVLEAANKIIAYRDLTNPLVAVDTADDMYSAGTHDYHGLQKYWDNQAQGGHLYLTQFYYLSTLSVNLSRERAEEIPDKATLENTVWLNMPGLSQGSYYPKQLVGVNATSHSTELAKELVGILISPAVQDYEFYNGLPVNRASFDARWEMVKQRDLEHMDDPKFYELDFDAVLATLQTPILPDAFLVDSIQEYGLQYFEGALTLEQAVEAIQQRVDMYIAERG